MAQKEGFNVDTMTRHRFPVPEIVYWPALEDDNKLTDNPPEEHGDGHDIETSTEPDLLGGEDAGVEKKDGCFDHGDCRGVEILKDVEAKVPLFHCVVWGNLDVLAEAMMGGCNWQMN